jgi:hypothetical protein
MGALEVLHSAVRGGCAGLRGPAELLPRLAAGHVHCASVPADKAGRLVCNAV